MRFSRLLLTSLVVLGSACLGDTTDSPSAEATPPEPMREGPTTVAGTLQQRGDSIRIEYGAIGSWKSSDGEQLPVFVDGQQVSSTSEMVWKGRLELPEELNTGTTELTDLPAFSYQWRSNHVAPATTDALCQGSPSTNDEGDPQCKVYVTRTAEGDGSTAGRLEVQSVDGPGGRIDVTLHLDAWTIDDGDTSRVCCGDFQVPIRSSVDSSGGLMLEERVLRAPSFHYCGFDSVAEALASNRCVDM